MSIWHNHIMRQFLIQTFIFLLASLTSVALMFVSRSYSFYQQMIPILLILDILVASRIKSTQDKFTFSKRTVLFVSSLLVQVIIISSGGLYSPLLILIHIFTLGAIFLLGSRSPIFFLIFSLGVFIFHISFDRNLYQFFQNDPWTIVIYTLSIIIVIPLALYLAHSNKIKDQFNNFLKDYIDVSEKKQKSILTALSNLVIITDKNLGVISINIATERLLRTSVSQVAGKSIADILILKDSRGDKVPFDSLPIKQAFSDKATHFVEGYFLETQIQALAKPVVLQIRPLTNSSGEIIQVVFVLTDPLVKIGFNTHPSLKEAMERRDLLLNYLTTPHPQLSPLSSQQTIFLIAHTEEDILTAQEMEDHPLQEVIGFIDLVTLIKQIIDSKTYFYQCFGDIPTLEFEDENKSEAAYLDLHQDISSVNLKPSIYSAPVDSYLLKIIIEKILDIAVFIASDDINKQKAQINLSFGLDKNIEVRITCPNPALNQNDLPNLFTRYYPGVKALQLQKSSGLEGYIAGKIAGTIHLPVDIRLDERLKTISFELVISKQARISAEN